ncbi:unnamed protein product (macronuclear) [Paramecium tetraurelia]|uniref:MARVEL domain-containing protein n=1 Tax=Paramecium tetraurelia TaxID=5888 RepID=A0E2U3_PARTE|nr:uncharacterized protein GSPATT00022782001 [Paramecium tetraurelia]CAK89610.1 unnamed protein product [Paramecium tetraurelia]|eukprot:XP_001457007.1 hypothetical protein (macronuclear) [Paramecium tetraurelia strain d4-2]
METKTWILILRWVNIVAAVVIGAMGIYQLVTFQMFSDFHFYEIWSIFTPVYSLIFCGLLLAIEFKKDFIADQFQFMMSCFGRGIFYIFLGSVVSYQPTGGSSTQVAGWIWGLTLWLVGIFYVVIHFVGPKSATAGLKDVIVFLLFQAVSAEYGTA